MTTEEREAKSAQWRTDNLGKNVGIANVVKSFVCDIDKGIRCEGSIADYKDGKCKVCGKQAN